MSAQVSNSRVTWGRATQMPSSLSEKLNHPVWPLLTVFVSSILITITFWSVLPAGARVDESSDFKTFYQPVAHNVLAGRGFVDTAGSPAVRYPPGYPIILAGIFGLARLLNVPESNILTIFLLICGGLTAILVFLLAKTIGGPVSALIAALAWATYPLALWLSKQPNSEIPFLVVFCGSFYLFWWALLRQSRAWPIYFLSGLLMGLAILIRPIAIGVGFPMIAILWLTAKTMPARFRLLMASMLLVGSFVAIAPWEFWVYAKTGRAVIVSTAGVPALRDGLTFAVNRKGFRQGVYVPEDVASLMLSIQARYSTLESFGDVFSIMAEQSRQRPLAVAKLYLIKVARSWYGTDSQRFETPIILVQCFYFLLIGWCSIVAWKRAGIPRKLALGIWFIIIYFWAMNVLSTTLVRYMVPVIALSFALLPVLFHKSTVKTEQREVSIT